LLEALATGDQSAEKCTAFVDSSRNVSGLRPSIETSVHAALPHAVVIHIHCVDTIALAVRADAEAAIATRLAGWARSEWIFTPYVKPGLALAQAIRSRLTPETNVIVLGNHGLIVGAGTVAEAADRTERICKALAERPREAPQPNLERLAPLTAGGDYRLPNDPSAHAVATDPRRLTLARSGTLYPDHAVFLGPGIVEGTIAEGRLLPPPGLSRIAPMLVAPGLGVALRRDLPKGADEMARCLADVTGRIAESAPIVPLTPAQEGEIVNWEAEKYRQGLNASARPL
jgi:rhamnose utilization protein RhaD (predicted bifunctional aldolase and dehydrogenase)